MDESVELEAPRALRRGLEGGGVGVVAARAGVGKSSCLVQIALDELVTGSAALHVSLDSPVAEVRRRYDEILDEAGIRGANERLEIEWLRHIHSYLDGSFTAEKLHTSMLFLAQHVDLEPRLVIIDDLELGDDGAASARALRELAIDSGVEIWLSAVTRRQPVGSDKLPASLLALSEFVDVVVVLEPNSEATGLRRWVRGGEGFEALPLTLDPTTMRLRLER